MTATTGFVILLLLTAVSTRFCPDPNCPPDDGTNQTILLPHTDCRNFYSCTMGFPTLLACPPGLRFNETTPGCVPKNQADCSECEEQEQNEQEEVKPSPEQFYNFFPFLH